ncbi:hypothetical protein RHMOL_Rhmol13G0152900 [Rhododendron molle]|uniref:Uncharacterized protein n=1 Tax=Rhododendron molle TaxID=49168 RepID=A0ACC0L829_RHOML|nr:hypothetical protein RHMOL_Rhmol13G0152900 [Rhododendron molle]
MADGTISVMEGLGCKAIDSNEMRRKQKGISDQLNPIQIQSLQVGNPKSTNPSEMGKTRPCSPSHSTRSSSLALPTHTPFDLCPGAPTTPVSSAHPSENPHFWHKA